jgi:ankyrin repeat protein
MLIALLPQEATTPLILAAASGHADCVKELLDQGADPRARRVVSTAAAAGRSCPLFEADLILSAGTE